MTGWSDSEFTCSTGSCVSMALRCNGRRDCGDGTDEKNCKTFTKFLGYNKFLVPPPSVKGQKLKLNLTVTVEAIIEINEIRNVIQTKFGYQRRWYNSQLTYQNLKEHSNNKVSPSNQELIWKPWIIYQNTADKNQITKTETPNILSIIPNADFSFIPGDLTNIQNTRLFEGSMNAIQEEKEYRIEWMCDFHMGWYPFDTQSCTMQFRNQYESIDLVPSNVTYAGPKDLVQNYVHDIKICYATIKGDQGIIVEIILGRPIFSSFLTTTLPTVMLIIISQLATSFSGEYMDMVIQVNLTVLLVLATL